MTVHFEYQREHVQRVDETNFLPSEVDSVMFEDGYVKQGDDGKNIVDSVGLFRGRSRRDVSRKYDGKPSRFKASNRKVKCPCERLGDETRKETRCGGKGSAVGGAESSHLGRIRHFFLLEDTYARVGQSII